MYQESSSLRCTQLRFKTSLSLFVQGNNLWQRASRGSKVLFEGMKKIPFRPGPRPRPRPRPRPGPRWTVGLEVRLLFWLLLVLRLWLWLLK